MALLTKEKAYIKAKKEEDGIHFSFYKKEEDRAIEKQYQDFLQEYEVKAKALKESKYKEMVSLALSLGFPALSTKTDKEMIEARKIEEDFLEKNLKLKELKKEYDAIFYEWIELSNHIEKKKLASSGFPVLTKYLGKIPEGLLHEFDSEFTMYFQEDIDKYDNIYTFIKEKKIIEDTEDC